MLGQLSHDWALWEEEVDGGTDGWRDMVLL